MGKRTLTPAQIEAMKLRREKFRGYVRELSKLSDEQRAELAKRLPVIATCEGHTLSLKNQMLVALQCPTATLVGGFKQWKRQGRAVRRGEHGYMIWVPSEYGRKGDDTPQPSEIDGKEEKAEVRFLVGTVFDLAQTESLDAQNDRAESEAA